MRSSTWILAILLGIVVSGRTGGCSPFSYFVPFSGGWPFGFWCYLPYFLVGGGFVAASAAAISAAVAAAGGLVVGVTGVLLKISIVPAVLCAASFLDKTGILNEPEQPSGWGWSSNYHEAKPSGWSPHNYYYYDKYSNGWKRRHTVHEANYGSESRWNPNYYKNYQHERRNTRTKRRPYHKESKNSLSSHYPRNGKFPSVNNILAFDSQFGCGMLFVCDLAAMPKLMRPPEGKVILELFGPKSIVSQFRRSSPDRGRDKVLNYSYAWMLGSRKQDPSTCYKTYARCPYNSQQILESLTKMLKTKNV